MEIDLPGGTSAPRQWTAEQWLAITLIDKSLLVSAAAGSGKTSVLAERCVHLVCDAEEKCDVDELLVVTFTEAAANEMRGRISRALRERAGVSSSNPARLNKQLALVDQAQVSTLHAFCARLLRQHFHRARLDPGFVVMDADEAYLLRREVANDLFERRFEDETGAFQSLIDGYGQGNDQLVLRDLLHVHELLTSVVSPAAWIAHARKRLAEPIDAPLEQTELGRELLPIIQRGLRSARQRCADTEARVVRLGFPKYGRFVDEISQMVQHWLEVFDAQGIDALAEAVKDLQWPVLPRVSPSLPGQGLARALVESLKDDLKKSRWFDMLRFTSREWKEGMEKVLPHANLFLDLVEEFSADYQQAKRAIRSVDFADLERYTLEVLSKPGTAPLHPSSAARAFHRRFAHVLVDEYQDINEVQDAILSLVSRECLAGEPSPAPRLMQRSAPSPVAALTREKTVLRATPARKRKIRDDTPDLFSLFSTAPCAIETAAAPDPVIAPERPGGNLFCVGDVKQSIYRFRLAEPARFLQRQREFRAPQSHGRVIDLQANFRGRLPLLGALNGVFARLMTADAVDIEYDKTHRLVGLADYVDADEGEGRSFVGAPIEMHLLPTKLPEPAETAEGNAAGDDPEELERAQREAIWVAREIGRILGRTGDDPMLVMDRDSRSLRPARPRDVVVLLRSMKFKADQFADVIHQQGIPVHAASNSGYFESMEVRDMLALLTLLDNQRQDIPLASILRSPFGGLDDAETSLARIRAAYPPDVPFHEAALRYAAERNDSIASALNVFFARLADWRHEAHRRPLADVIWAIYHQSGYLTYVAGLKKGEQRVRNLLNLHERAAQFGSFQSRGLSRFMRFLEQLREESDLGQPSIASEAEDVVRVMSIHRSKGLEFPIVIVPDLGKRINLQDSQGAILADRAGGLGMKTVDEAKRCRYPSLASTLVESRLRQQALAEEMRVLYVAMTRAREHLILVGTCATSQLEKWGARWEGHVGPLPTDSILSARTLLDWLVPAGVAMRNEPRPMLQTTVHPPEEVAGWRTPDAIRVEVSPLQSTMMHGQALAQRPPITDAARDAIERLSFVYPHQRYSELPATQSVTARGHAAPQQDAAAAIFNIPQRLPARPRFLEQAALSATDRGTATHLVLQYLNFAGPCDAPDIAAQIEALVDRRVLSPEQAAVVDRAAIVWLMESRIGRLLRRDPAAVRRELPVNFPALPEFSDGVGASSDPLDRVMIRGRIDVLVLGPETATLLDYKTDNITKEQIPARAALYRPQLQAYREAIERISGIKIAEVCLAFLSPRELWTYRDDNPTTRPDSADYR